MTPMRITSHECTDTTRPLLTRGVYGCVMPAGEINSLEEEEVNGVIDVIKVAESIVDDAEIDLGELQDSTMWKLRHFVDEVKRMKSAR